ncbi:hypothetical protein SK128_013703 [Halocaridina rubra]|uniref:C-type lectin domain-containing protein n=1 Tax=Halocaridina rubra TaxID=373956 RepID=A0AAN9AFK1_HALRR
MKPREADIQMTGRCLLALGTMFLSWFWIYGIQGENVVIYHLQPDIWEPPRDDVFIRFNMSNQNTAAYVTEFTICSRSYYTTLTTLQVLLSYASADTFDNAIMMYVRDGEHVFRYNNKPQAPIEKIKVPTVLRKWRHYCHVIDAANYSVYVDGKLMARGPVTVPDRVLPLNGSFIVGQEQDGYSRGFSRVQLLKGYASQINIWSYGLDSTTVEDIAFCKRNVLGNVFSSDREEMELFGAERSVAPLSDLCREDEKFILFPERRTYTESRVLCQLLGSELYAPSNIVANEVLFNLTLENNVCRQQFSTWIGVTDNEEEGVWRRVSDNKIITDIKFKQGQPDNVRFENCINMESELGAWSDFPCYDATLSCSPCEERLHIPLFLRGLCMKLKSETLFEVIGYSDKGSPYFHGYYGLMITRGANNYWTLFSTVTNRTQAYLNMSSTLIYPLGRNYWILTESFCEHSAGSTTELSLSACDDGEYMCDNGECISLHTRCDSKDDCSDESDEDNCFTVKIPEDYRSFKPPKNVENSSLSLQPFLKVEFLRFLSIEDVKESIQIEFMIQLSWPDSRVKYMNLRDDTLDNPLAESEVEGLWRPKIDFPNIKDGALKLLGENLYILKLKKALPSDFNDVKMGKLSPKFSFFLYPLLIQWILLLVPSQQILILIPKNITYDFLHPIPCAVVFENVIVYVVVEQYLHELCPCVMQNYPYSSSHA